MSKMSNRIFQSMRAAGMTYRTLQEMTGIHRATLQRYATERTKKISIDRIELIAKAVGVSAAYLMGWDSDEHEETMPVSPEPYRAKSHMPNLENKQIKADLSEPQCDGLNVERAFSIEEIEIINLFRNLPESKQKAFIELLRVD